MLKYPSLLLRNSHRVLTLNAYVSQSIIMVAIVTYGKYVIQDWEKIKKSHFPNTGVYYFDKVVKSTGFIQCVIAIHRILLSYFYTTI